MENLTPSQQRAVAARGNVLVMAGAGTGKTRTLVERCLDCIVREGASLDEILVVTFTEAAATEMKQRLRAALERTVNRQPSTINSFAAEQLALFDAAHIGTLHGFCFKLVREHFYELGLDPQLAILAEGEARMLANTTLDEQFQAHYEGGDEFSLAAQYLIQIYGGGLDEKIRALVLRLHNYAQTRPDAEGWLAEQIEIYSAAEPIKWRGWFSDAVVNWHDEWLPALENLRAENPKAAECLDILRKSDPPDALRKISAADADWPRGTKKFREPLEDFFGDANFLKSLITTKENDPLAEDWDWIRGHMSTLLRLAREFAKKFSDQKRTDGVLDFHDLEQFALKLLWNFETEKPTLIAKRWREKLRFVFVDEYQDINAAQDKIISALSREGANANRFLVGDVKQSIYRFRLADPKIFRDYAKSWHDKDGQTIPLSENFRSRESLLNFVNSLFTPLMREEIGGVNYDNEAKLKFGSPETRAELSAAKNQSPSAELLLRLKKKSDEISDGENGEWADLEESAREARLIALHLKNLEKSGHPIWDDKREIFRAVKLSDMAVLLRSPSGKAEIFAKEFERAGVKFSLTRGGFYDSSEILDLLSLLQLLDNPLQDVPCIAVLRSPLVGCSLDELAEIRLASSGHFWFALNQVQNSELKITDGLRTKIGKFLERFHRWRKLAQQSSLSQCLEEVLAETHYADWLRSRPRGAQRRSNVEHFLNLAQRFDQFQRQGLFRYLKFIEAQREIEAEPEVPAAPTENAVQLMSIHQSKGLEFPVVVLADLAKRFNEQDLIGEIIFDEEFGVCPKVQAPNGRRYPSLPHWLAQRRQRLELRGEELRLLYVALTRARDTLILSGGITQKKWDELWAKPTAVTPQAILSAKSFADWLGLWFSVQSPAFNVQNAARGELPDLRWRIVDEAELTDGNKSESGNQKTEIELPALDAATAEKLGAVLAWEYPFVAATKRKAKSSVTELRRAAEEQDNEAEQVFPPRKFLAKRMHGKLSAAEAGVAHHKFLQHVALERTGDRALLAAEAERLEQEKILSADERAVLDLDALADFWNSAPGRKIRAQPPGSVKRELPFTARFSPPEIAEIKGEKPDAGLENEFVVVQGVADLAVLLSQEIWLVDFKTDNVRASELPAKTKFYEPQLKLYARALTKIYSRQVTSCWLHFLDARKTVAVKI
jgi:ATP-dependent helicase/nuclease subunit A